MTRIRADLPFYSVLACVASRTRGRKGRREALESFGRGKAHGQLLSCSLNLLFSDVQLPLPSWFSLTPYYVLPGGAQCIIDIISRV